LVQKFQKKHRRGGANGGRIRLSPFKDWEVNNSEKVKKVLSVYEKIKNEKVSIADLIVLGGCAAIEKAAGEAGFEITVPFVPGRVDTKQEYIEERFYAVTEPFADGFINYIKNPSEAKAEELLVDKANLLTLTVPEMVVLLGGLRVLGANYGFSNYGVFTENVGILTNDFFINLLDMNIEWKSIDKNYYLFEGYDRKTGKQKWKATRVDLIIGHHNELRAVAEVYASDEEKFIKDFVKTWDKVINLDRFDLKFGN